MTPFQKAFKNVATIFGSLNPAKLAKVKATNVQIPSARSVRFDLPNGIATDGINRIKITDMGDGTLRIQLLRIEEIDVVGGVPPEKLGQVLSTFTGIDL